MTVSDDTLARLPKTDLHCHLDGSLRLSTILELAAEQGVALGARDVAELGRRLHVGQHCASLEDYLEAFDVTLAVLQTEAALRRVTFELLEDAAREGVWYLELRFSPVLHVARGLTPERALLAVLEGVADAERALTIRAGVIVCAIRNMPPAVGVELARLAVAHRSRGVVAFDLAGGEAGHPASAHAEAYAVARRGDLGLTVHAGEGAGADSIRDALHECCAHRIGHGCRLFEDPALLRYVNDHRVPLEMCPTSNEQTRAVASVAVHPLARYLAEGLLVTVNTDNRLMSDTTVTREITRLHREAGLDARAIRQLLLNGFEAAFLPWPERAALRARAAREIDRWMPEGRPSAEEALGA